MRLKNPETGKPTRTGVALVAFGYAAVLATIGVEATMWHGQGHDTVTAQERPLPVESTASQGSGPSPTPEATQTTEAPAPTHQATNPKPNTPKPKKTTHAAQAPKRKASSSGNTTAASMVLDPNNCNDWSPSHPHPLIKQGGAEKILVDNRPSDGCDAGFYSGASIHEGPSATSKEVDLGVTFNTAGSLALKGSVLPIKAWDYGQSQSAHTPDGVESSNIWLRVDLGSNKQTWISGIDAGYPSAAMLTSAVGPAA